MSASADSARDPITGLVGSLDSGRVLDTNQLGDYAVGSFVPSGVVTPVDVQELRETLEWAHGNDVAVYPFGGRTLKQLGNVPARPGIALDMSALNRMVDFQPADLTVRVQAGMTVETLDSTLAQDAKYVPLAPPLPSLSTIGGTLATGISGPLRATYGLPRDWLIGMTVVGPDGTMSKCGGQVVKNVTGYDLNRLYTGSLGTLAVIAEATFKITPAPSAWAAVVAAFENHEAGIAVCRDLLAQPFAPHALHLLSPDPVRRLNRDYLPVGYGSVAIAIIAGRPASVRRRVEEIALAWLTWASTLHIEDEEAIRLTGALADLPFDPADPPSVCVRINAQPSALDAIVSMASYEIAGAQPGIVADAGFGGGRLIWWNDASQENPHQLAHRLKEIQANVIDLGGSAIVETCPADAKSLIDVWGPNPSGMEIMRRIKNQFDPKGVLNPGRFVGGL